MRALLLAVLAASTVQGVDGSCTGVDCGTGATCEVGPLECTWVANNLNTNGEVQFDDVSTPAACIEQCINAGGGYTIANIDTAVLEGGSGECWCQFGDNMAEDPGETEISSCLLSTAATTYTCAITDDVAGSDRILPCTPARSPGCIVRRFLINEPTGYHKAHEFLSKALNGEGDLAERLFQ